MDSCTAARRRECPQSRLRPISPPNLPAPTLRSRLHTALFALCGLPDGQVAEWFKAAVLKTAVGASSPWVRIPPCPPLAIAFMAGWLNNPRLVGNDGRKDRRPPRVATQPPGSPSTRSSRDRDAPIWSGSAGIPPRNQIFQQPSSIPDNHGVAKDFDTAIGAPLPSEAT